MKIWIRKISFFLDSLSAQKRIPKSAGIPSQTLPARGKQPTRFCESFSPEKLFRKNRVRIRSFLWNRFERSHITTPLLDKSPFWTNPSGRHEVPTKHFPLIFQKNLARLRALIFRQGGGSESNAIFAIIQKDFCLKIYFDILVMHTILLISQQKWLC